MAQIGDLIVQVEILALQHVVLIARGGLQPYRVSGQLIIAPWPWDRREQNYLSQQRQAEARKSGDFEEMEKISAERDKFRAKVAAASAS